MDLDKEFGNKVPKVVQDLSGNLEAKFTLKGQLGVTTENKVKKYQVSPAQHDDTILMKVPISSCISHILTT